MLIIYQAVSVILSFILFPFLWLSKSARPKLMQRYACWRLPESEYVWFHGASAGEINGLLPIIARYNGQYKTLGTATSVAGLEKIAEHVDEARLLPIDNFLFVRLALGSSEIKKFIFGETELWPALLTYLNKKNVEIYQANARLSDFNFKYYKFFKSLFSKLINRFKKIYPIDQETAERFQELNTNQNLITVYGNLKYDRAPKITNSEEAANLKKEFFNNDWPILVLGSIRPGEEEVCFPVLKALKEFNCIVAPRHAEKFSYFAEKLEEYEISYTKRSQALPSDGCVLLDTFGELEACFSFATITFVGASLIPGIGGHNPMEPAAYGNIIVMGPYYNNQRDSVSLLKAEGGIVIVESQEDFKQVLKSYKDLTSNALAAKKTWQSFQGITDKVYQEIFAHA